MLRYTGFRANSTNILERDKERGVYRNMRCILEVNSEALGWESTLCSFAILFIFTWGLTYLDINLRSGIETFPADLY